MNPQLSKHSATREPTTSSVKSELSLKKKTLNGAALEPPGQSGTNPVSTVKGLQAFLEFLEDAGTNALLLFIYFLCQCLFCVCL